MNEYYYKVSLLQRRSDSIKIGEQDSEKYESDISTQYEIISDSILID